MDEIKDEIKMLRQQLQALNDEQELRDLRSSIAFRIQEAKEWECRSHGRHDFGIRFPLLEKHYCRLCGASNPQTLEGTF